jgi:hypothetical protein
MDPIESSDSTRYMTHYIEPLAVLKAVWKSTYITKALHANEIMNR